MRAHCSQRAAVNAGDAFPAGAVSLISVCKGHGGGSRAPNRPSFVKRVRANGSFLIGSLARTPKRPRKLLPLICRRRLTEQTARREGRRMGAALAGKTPARQETLPASNARVHTHTHIGAGCRAGPGNEGRCIRLSVFHSSHIRCPPRATARHQAGCWLYVMSRFVPRDRLIRFRRHIT